MCIYTLVYNPKCCGAFIDISQDEVATAQPEIDEKTASLVSKGKWLPAGYKERFGDLSIV
jgi:hypothetical protein